jgi:formate-dependent nitrite reductase membrane component NrfD
MSFLILLICLLPGLALWQNRSLPIFYLLMMLALVVGMVYLTGKITYDRLLRKHQKYTADEARKLANKVIVVFGVLGCLFILVLIFMLK